MVSRGSDEITSEHSGTNMGYCNKDVWYDKTVYRLLWCAMSVFVYLELVFKAGKIYV